MSEHVDNYSEGEPKPTMTKGEDTTIDEPADPQKYDLNAFMDEVRERGDPPMSITEAVSGLDRPFHGAHLVRPTGTPEEQRAVLEETLRRQKAYQQKKMGNAALGGADNPDSARN